MSNFELPDPINPEEYPPVVPNPRAATKVDKSQYFFPDEHALMLRKQHFLSFKELMWDLVFCQKFTPLQKARVIFRWLTLQNLQTIKFQTVPPDSPEEVFLQFQIGDVASFSRTYQLLACYAGLYCVNIYGFSKGVDYLPGDKFQETPVNHTWNAVYFDNVWHLLDCHWAMRYLSTTIDDITPEAQFVYEFDEFYFCMNPYQSVYSHWPLDEQWQLLDQKKLSLSQFELLPMIKTQFFLTGMFFFDTWFGTLYAPDGKLKFTLKYRNLAEFTCKLEALVDGKMVDEYNGVSLKNFALIETHEKLISIYFRISIPGVFFLTIFNKIINTEEDLNQNVFRALAMYKIICTSPNPDVTPYNGFVDTNFGPSWPLMHHYGIEPLNYSGGIIEVQARMKPARCEVSFRVLVPSVSLVAKIRYPHNEMPEPEGLRAISPYDDTLVTDSVSDDVITFNVTLPELGEYVLEVYANNPVEGDTFTHICQYLLDFKRVETDRISLTYKPPVEAKDLANLPDPYTLGYPAESTYKLSSALASQRKNNSDLESSRDMNDSKGKYAVTEDEIQPDYVQKIHSVKPIDDKSSLSSGGSDNKSPLRAPVEFTPELAAPVETHEVHEGTLPTKNFGGLKGKQRDSEETQDSLKERQMDEETMDISRRGQENFNDLIWQLIYSRNLANDQDKIRAIFLWLVSKNLNEIDFPNPEPESPEETLMNIKHSDTTYADAFAMICRYANIKCKVIQGYAKGAGFVPGVKLTSTPQAKHTWNAALVDGRWHLFDCHWSARRILGKERTLEHIFYNVDDFYYMPDPNHLKYSHHPFEEKWQLTTKPIPLEEFEKLTPVKSSYFKHNLTLHSHPYGYVECNEPFVVIKIGFPPESVQTVSFTFSLQHEALGQVYKSEDLSTYGMHELIMKSSPYEAFTFRFPRPGIYSASVYVRDVSSETFATACEYRIDVQFDQDNKTRVPMPFPVTQQNGYGPTDTAYKLGIGCLHSKSSVICGVEESIDIKFYCKNPKEKLPNMIGQLRGMGLNEEKLSHFVLQRVVSDSEEFDKRDILVITPFLPVAGEYALEIYAQDPKNETTKYFLAWQFLLHSEKPHNYGPLPVLTGNILGPLPEFRQLGLATISHHDPLVRVPVIEAKDEKNQRHPSADLAIDIKTPPLAANGFPTARVIAQLSTMNEQGNEEILTEFVLQQLENEVLTCLIRFPSAGLYKLHLYGHPLPDVEDSVPVVYTYLLHAPPRLSASALPYQGSYQGPYPKQSNKWKEGAVLHSPMNGKIKMDDLYKDKMVHFSVVVPRAKDVTVVYDGQVFHLDGTMQGSNGSCLWEGKVAIPIEEGKKISIAGRWTVKQSSYPSLLEYTVTSK